MIEQTSLGHIEFWPPWDMYKKIISVLAVVGRHMILLDQDKLQDVSYFLGVIPYRVGIYGEVSNFVGVCHFCVKIDT